MAGRPPAGSATGLLVGMCVSIGIALISLVLLVVLWTGQEELRASEAKANSDAQRLMKSGDMRGPLKDWFDLATGGKSLAKLMSDEMVELGQVISSDATAATPGLAQQFRDNQLTAFWDKVEDDGLVENPGDIVERPLLESINALYDLYVAEHETSVQSVADLRQCNAERTSLADANTQLQQDFDKAAGDLQASLAAVEDEWGRYRTKKEDQYVAIEAAGQARADDNLQQTQNLRGQLDTLFSELSKKETQNKELRDKYQQFLILPHPRMAARQGDGHVLLTNASAKSIFIDLGVDDHLTLGLRFAVYPPDPGIPGSGVAKAAVEVVSIGEEVSQCRIVHEDRLFPILKGDLVANPIYDRNRKLNFLVIGAFDLNHDGLDDSNGRGTIEAVIKDAGGSISDELHPRIDFVVAGARPYVKRLPSDASAEQQAVYDDQTRNAQGFSAIINEAQSLTIPVLTQETFLNFLGRRR